MIIKNTVVTLCNNSHNPLYLNDLHYPLTHKQ